MTLLQEPQCPDRAMITLKPLPTMGVLRGFGAFWEGRGGSGQPCSPSADQAERYRPIRMGQPGRGGSDYQDDHVAALTRVAPPDVFDSALRRSSRAG